MNKLKYIFLIVSGFVMISCMKDLGNYKYEDVGKPQIGNLPASISVTIPDNLKITPTVNIPENDCKTVWFVQIKDKTANDVETYADTLSRQLSLDVPFEYPVGAYTLYLKVTDKTTGVSEYASTEVSVISGYSTGYYLLKETIEGNTELDFHRTDGNVFSDLIAKSNGTALNGKPKTLSYLNGYCYLNETTGQNDINSLLVALSEKDCVTLNMMDMSQARGYDQWYFDSSNIYPVEKIHHFNNLCYSYGMFAEDGLFTNYQCAAWEMYSSGKLASSADIMMDGTLRYSCASDVCYFVYSAYFYDSLNSAINYVNLNGECYKAKLQYTPLTSGQNPKLEKLADRVIYVGGVSPEDNYVIIICEREDGSKYLYYALADEQVLNIEAKSEITLESAFDGSVRYATCRKGSNYVYSLYNNEIYAMNPDNGQVAKLVLPDLPAGEITCFDTMYYDHPEVGYNHFVVATYKDGAYTVSFYEMIGGEPVAEKSPVITFSGIGRVKTLQHTDPGKQGNGVGEYTYSLHY